MLRTIDQQLQLTQRITEQMHDPRDPERIRHPVVDLLRQRVYGLAYGYEDLNDHDTLRNDIAFQTAVEKDQAWAAAPPCAGSNSGRTRVDVAEVQAIIEA